MKARVCLKLRQPGPGQKDGDCWFVRIARWHPTRLNEWDGRHWSVRARAKNADAILIATACIGADVPQASGRRQISLVITLAPRQRGGDPDSYWKTTLDGLVRCGALQDDNKENLLLGSVEYRRGTAKATTIVIENVPRIQ